MRRTFICIASGPSLTRTDCIMAWSSGHEIIAVNSSWKLIPESHYLYAGDLSWWSQYYEDISSASQKWTSSVLAANRFHLNLYQPEKRGPFNSGQRAIQLAAHLGAERILLLGYDCSVESGSHWHGDHPGKLHNPVPREVTRWHTDFLSLNTELPDTEIINCSRRTALSCFPQQSPESIFHA